MKKIQIASRDGGAAGEWMALHGSPGPFTRPPKRGVAVTIPMISTHRVIPGTTSTRVWNRGGAKQIISNYNIQVPWCTWEAKLRVVFFGVLMNYHCNLFYLNMQFSISFPYCFESRRGVIERCVSRNHATPISSQALRRPQESGEEAKARVRKSTNWLYEFVWIAWMLHGCYTVLLFGLWCESLKPWISRFCSRPVIHFVHCRHWRPLQTSSSGSWQRREKKNWVRFHWDCIHSIRWSLQSLLKLNSMKFKVVCSCNPSFSAGILLSRIGRVCFPCFFLGPEHIKGFGRTACGHSKQPSVQVLFRLTKNSTFWYLFRIRSFVQGQ